MTKQILLSNFRDFLDFLKILNFWEFPTGAREGWSQVRHRFFTLFSRFTVFQRLPFASILYVAITFLYTSIFQSHTKL